MKDVQCDELFGGIALKNHAFSFHMYISHQVLLPKLTYVHFILGSVTKSDILYILFQDMLPKLTY